MDKFANLLLAQSADMADLKNGVVHGFGIVVILMYLTVVLMIIDGCIQDVADGSWKYALAKGLGLFGNLVLLLWN